MSLKIGHLTEDHESQQRVFTGKIFAFEKELEIRLERRGGSSPNAPDYAVLLQNTGAQFSPQIGAAWLKTPQREGATVKEFLSITLDSPDFSAPLNVAAFPTGGEVWDITWRRRLAAS